MAVALRAQSMPSQSDVQAPQTTTFCELAQQPATYNKKLIRVTAFITYGFEDFQLTDPNCPGLTYQFSVWVMYGGKAESGAVYCCPGEGGNESRQKGLSVDGIEIPLVDDLVFKQFNELVRKERDTTVRGTFVGRFFAGEKQNYGGPTFWGGYGHLSCCSLFAIERVEAFEPHTAQDVDYTAEGGWNEPEGCKNASVGYPRHVSITYNAAEARQVIEEQRRADSGERRWAYSDPHRVVVESIGSIYKQDKPVLKQLKTTHTRVVFRWKYGNKSIVFVATRPYWLSFYSKTGSPIWVSTTIKEATCR